MPTLNLTAGPSWAKVADSSHPGFIAQSPVYGDLEWATTSEDAAPADTLAGHVLPAQTVVGRGILGPGHVWVRLRPPLTQAMIVVTR